MSGALRIRRASPGAARAAVEEPKPPSEYLERLVKLIPTEIVGLYLGGKAAIQTRYIDFHTPAVGAPSQDPPVLGPNEDVAWVGWTAICFFALLAVRAWATKENDRPQWSAVLIAAISYLIWVYSFGDVFHLVMGIWDPLPATLLVLVWTFAVPVFYRGDPAPTVMRPQLTPPIGEYEVGELVIEAARTWHVDPSLFDPVKPPFMDGKGVRELLTKVQVLLLQKHGLKVDLSKGATADYAKLAGKSYADVASWAFKKVAAA